MPKRIRLWRLSRDRTQTHERRRWISVSHRSQAATHLCFVTPLGAGGCGVSFLPVSDAGCRPHDHQEGGRAEDQQQGARPVPGMLDGRRRGLCGRSGCFVRTGPRPSGKDFLAALKAVYKEFGDGKPHEAARPGASKAVKDNGIDVIAWRRQADRLPGTHYLIGQVASGSNWREQERNDRPEAFPINSGSNARRDRRLRRHVYPVQS